ncbi:MAG: hypothetical protein N2595_09995 [bacterium]|nr:hypothetical protein [bacterium]
MKRRGSKQGAVWCWCLAGVLVSVGMVGCAGPYAIGYAIDPLEGPPVKLKTPVLVRTLADRRPAVERIDPPEAEGYRFFSSDKCFREPVDVSITRMLQLELANAGLEVAAEGNHLLGDKPYIRITGDILHFFVSRRPLPIATIQDKVNTLWLREQYTVRVELRIEMIDTRSGKQVMSRRYISSDSFAQRSEMLDVKGYLEDPRGDLQRKRWRVAGDEYAVQLLNEHLKRALVQARKDIVLLLTP